MYSGRILSFFIPRILWVLVHERYLTFNQLIPTHTQSHEKSKSTVDSTTGSTSSITSWLSSSLKTTFEPESRTQLDVVKKYNQVLAEVQHWLQTNGYVTSDKLERLLKPIRTRLDQLNTILIARTAMPLPIKRIIFLSGASKSGKTEFLNALLGVEIASAENSWLGPYGLAITKTIYQQGDMHYEIYEIPSAFHVIDQPASKLGIPSESFQSWLFESATTGSQGRDASLQRLFYDFLVHKQILPDLILHTVKSAEMHSRLPHELSALRWIQRCINEYALMNLDIPIHILLTHTDQVHPSDLKRADEYDHDKCHSMKLLHQLARTFFDKENTVRLSSSPLTAVKIHVGEILSIATKVYWTTTAVDGVEQRQPHSGRNYVYNIDAVRAQLSACLPLQLNSDRPHTYFGLQLIQLFTQVGSHAGAQWTTTLWNKYQLEAYLVTLLALEFSAPTPSEDVSDPVTFGQRFKLFWQTLGLSPLALHSLKPIADHLMRQVPMLGQIVAEVELMRDVLGLEEALRRVGEAALGHFAEQCNQDDVKRLFEGQVRL